MFEYAGLVEAIAAIGGLVGATLGFVVYALADTAPLERPFVERRASKVVQIVLKKAA